MNIKPILFNTEMVKAIQDGRKTQTRRIVKNQDGIHPRRSNIGFFGWDDGHGYQMMPPCKEGDILWVRETWRPARGTMHTYINGDVVESDDWHEGFEYKAGGYHFPDGFKESEDEFHLSELRSYGNWRPSIHMPKQAARIFLRVKNVRVEQLQDITEEQAEAEGCADWHIEITGGPWGVEDDPDEGTAVDDFKRVWDSTIPRHPCKFKRHLWYWEDNPWVWVIEFERCEKPEGWC